MNIKQFSIINALAFFTAAMSIPLPLIAADLSLASKPLFLTSVKPNVMIMLDNSASMKHKLYSVTRDDHTHVEFDSSNSYYGIFDAAKTYEYNTAIPINTGAYNVTVATPYPGAFVEAVCVPPGGAPTCWSGNYLNWLTTRRIDASRMVLVGGKLESTTGFDYDSDGDYDGDGSDDGGIGPGDLNYKIVANNEPRDMNFSAANANSLAYSPIPNDIAALVTSPVTSGNVETAYDPYAKIKAGAAGAAGKFIYGLGSQVIGEFGQVTTDENWKTVTLLRTYLKPVVVAKTPTHIGGDPSVIRIRNVTSTSFEVQIQEWDFLDADHRDEVISYIVMEDGEHVLQGGVEVQAKTITDVSEEYVTRSCGSYPSADNSDYKSINFDKTFPAVPVVIAAVTSYEGSSAVTVRAWDIDSSSMKLSLQEEEINDGIHSAEEVSYIAIVPAHFVDALNGWSLKAASLSSFDDSWKTIAFDTTDPFSAAPFFLAGMQTINDPQPAVLRINSPSSTEVEIHVEEEQSCDSDVSHTDEDVAYIALEGSASPAFNIVLAVGAKPVGLLHELDGEIGLGISFYRFSTSDSTLYDQIQDGGTMNFKIPNNPFVNNPGAAGTGSGFRDLKGYIGESLEDISDAIQNYPLIDGTTPLAENLWEVIQYFEQDEPYSDPLDSVEAFDLADDLVNPERDPFYSTDYGRKLECIKSSVIILTDGDSAQDVTLPDAIVDYDNDANHGDSKVKDDGKDNLDDVAYWAYCDKASGSCFNGEVDDNNERKASSPSRDLRSDIENPGSGDGIPQYLSVYTIGFGGGDTVSQVLKDTANNAGGKSYAASDGTGLKNALTEAFTAAIDDSSASAVSVNTGSLTEDTVVFQAQFNSNDWSGVLQAYPISTSDGSLGEPVTASVIPAHASRKIVTYNGTKGIRFQWPSDPENPTTDELTDDQQTDLADSELLLNYLRGDQTNEDGSGTGEFRLRTNLLGDLVNSSPAFVGDGSDFVYSDNLESDAHSAFRTTVSDRTPVVYVGSNDGMLHAFNANSSDADDNGVIDDTAFGQEIFAFVPNQVLSRLPALGNKDYVHHYTVDGSPTVGDAYFDPTGGNSKSWHTILVAGLNGGGQGIYALDITDPVEDVTTETSAAAKVLWEFNDIDRDDNNNLIVSGDRDLGYTYSQPNIVRMDSGEWAAVFGNGYNNTEADDSASGSGNAVLYIVSIETGKLIRKIDTGVGIDHDDGVHNVLTTPNGLSTVAPVDFNGDSIVDFIYGGDLYGNLWRFNVTGNANTWEVANNAPLFTASYPVTSCTDDNDPDNCTTAKIRQPVTSRPQVGFHPSKSGYMVYFGTGQYLETDDNSTVDQLTQTFYGIWDKDENWAVFNSDHLLQQSVLLEKCFNLNEDTGVLDATSCAEDSASDFGLRISSDTSIVWHTDDDDDDSLPTDGDDEGDLVDTHMGWYMPLYNTDAADNATGDNMGERQVSSSILRNGRIIFTTLIPSADPCSGGGTGWLMELDAESGARLEFSPFDLNDDEAFNSLDFVTVKLKDDDGNDVEVKVPVSGKKSKEGIITSPTIVDDGSVEYKYNSGSKGGVEVTRENPGPQYVGRQSWKQLEF